ncbi:related to Broad-specificity phosphatase YOR283W [Zygosaccharomyces bailii ISA1307]|nr:related to Broad-specificity phosphatase YOR283W [Zygosaccharomyces bailii ISA1307]
MTKDFDSVGANVLRLLVIRHGQTDYNIKQIMQGHKDIALNQTGFEQARLLGKRLVNESVVLDSVASSDLTRCKQTVATVLETCHQSPPVKYYYELRERHMGVIQGMQIKEAEKYAAEHGKSSIKDFGETSSEFLNRFSTCFTSIAQEAAANGETTVAVFTHGGAIRSLLVWLKFDSTNVPVKIPNTSITVVDYNKDTKEFKVKCAGDAQHLQDESGPITFVGDSRVL